MKLVYILADSLGKQFGELTVIGPPSAGDGAKWRVRCSCGKEYDKSKYSLFIGINHSCGCQTAQFCKEVKTKHGHTWGKGGATPEYFAWQHMIGRCHNPNNQDYAVYGGRGIVVCDRWRNNFAAFLEDMGARPETGMSIDRIDNELGYFKENCRWATRKTQSRNLRSNRTITIDGVTRCVGEWAEITGLGDALYRRLYSGWDETKAVRTPKRGQAVKV